MTAPLIPCMVKMYGIDGAAHQYTGLFRSTFAAVEDAMNRFGNGVAFATPLNQTREAQA
ncbi:hypothetical protein [Nitrosomonas sp.]|uniref:hypothetical protein n=1 Tax=Nitrosomonas sp. TaxID=42353 RepID=UPI0037CC9AAE